MKQFLIAIVVFISLRISFSNDQQDQKNGLNENILFKQELRQIISNVAKIAAENREKAKEYLNTLNNKISANPNIAPWLNSAVENPKMVLSKINKFAEKLEQNDLLKPSMTAGRRIGELGLSAIGYAIKTFGSLSNAFIDGLKGTAEAVHKRTSDPITGNAGKIMVTVQSNVFDRIESIGKWMEIIEDDKSNNRTPRT